MKYLPLLIITAKVKKDSDNHGKDNNYKVIENLSLKLQQKREVEQLGVNPTNVLQEEEKRRPLFQQE